MPERGLQSRISLGAWLVAPLAGVNKKIWSIVVNDLTTDQLDESVGEVVFKARTCQ